MSEHKYINRGGTASMIVASVCNEHRNCDLRADNAAILRAINERFEFLESQRENLRDELKAAQEERDKAVSSRDAVWALINDLRAEIARLRQERASAANEMLDRVRASLREYPHGGGDIEVMREVDRIISEATDRMRKALEVIACGVSSDGAVNIAKRALNPQPAQPEEQAEPSDVPALIELARDYVQKLSPEETAEARRLSAISFAFGNVSIHDPNVTYAMVEKAYGKTFPENQND